MEKFKSLKKNAILNSFKTFVTLCFPLITFPYSTRVLGPENIGKVNFANSIVAYFAMIASLGLWSYAVREAAKIRDDNQKLNQFAKEIFTINIVSTVIAYILLVLAIFFVPKFENYRSLMVICGTLIFFNTIGMDWIYSAIEDYLYITIRSLFFQVLSLILLFVLVKKRDDYLQYAAINIIANVGANICNFTHSKKYISFKNCKKLELKKHLKPIFILFAFAIASSIFTTLDTSMLGFLASDTDVGYYSAGVKLTRMVRNLFPAVYTVLFARLAYYFAHKDEKSLQDLTAKTLNFCFCFALPVSVGLILLMKPLVLLFCGQTYLDAITVSKIMCPFIIFSACSGFLGGGILIAFGKEKIYLLTILIAAVIDILFNFILIPTYKANGAAIATLITEAFIMIFYFVYLRKFIKKIKILKNILQYILSTIVMGLCVFFSANTFSTNIALQLVIPTLCGICIYFLCLVVLRNQYILQQCESILKK